MMKKIELTAEELSAFDQVIAQKQRGTEMFIGGIIDCVNHIVPVVTVLIQVTQAIGADALSEPTVKALADVVNKASVEDLIALRKKAILKN